MKRRTRPRPRVMARPANEHRPKRSLDDEAVRTSATRDAAFSVEEPGDSFPGRAYVSVESGHGDVLSVSAGISVDPGHGDVRSATARIFVDSGIAARIVLGAATDHGRQLRALRTARARRLAIALAGIARPE